MRISTTKRPSQHLQVQRKKRKKGFCTQPVAVTYTSTARLNTSTPLLRYGSVHQHLPTHPTALSGETAETHRSFSKDYWHQTGKQHVNLIIRLCNTCIDIHKSSSRWFLLMTCINLVYFSIISQGFSFITHSFYRGGRKTKLVFAKRTSAMWPLKSERGFKEGSPIQSLFLL